jgi:hypothetical protein
MTCGDGGSSSGGGTIAALWANNGADKVTKDESRAVKDATAVINSVWDGEKITVFGAKNEVVAFNLIIEASSDSGLTDVSVSFDSLSGPGGASISSTAATGNGVFDWTNRPIELFYIRYLQIKGLSSNLFYDNYDERHIPDRFQRPWTGDGEGSGDWDDRPDHDKYYPDIAVPLELVSDFDISAGENQSIWVDVYIPKTATAGKYTGTLTVSEDGTTSQTVTVELTVKDFTLPDTPNAKTMLVVGYEDINERYLGNVEVSSSSDVADSKTIRDRHFLMAHRHKISIVDSNCGGESDDDEPCSEWLDRLDGDLFSATNGYDGPGVGVGNDIFAIGLYGTWGWSEDGQAAMNTHTNAWVDWFDDNSPNTEYFLYLADEPEDEDTYEEIEEWAGWINANAGSGSELKSFTTVNLPIALAEMPSVDVVASWANIGVTSTWANADTTISEEAGKDFYLYNSFRPATGSFAIEDDGVALRQLAWAQYKKDISRWFYWESTYYNNYQGNTGQTDVFTTAHTFGDYDETDDTVGQTGFNYNNGDGVLFYPGTDLEYTDNSYGLKGPLASLRLKHWRRGIQDVDYLTLAAAIDADEVEALVKSMIPKVLWECGVDDAEDPTYVTMDISWSIDPDDWEDAREALADIIAGGS